MIKLARFLLCSALRARYPLLYMPVFFRFFANLFLPHTCLQFLRSWGEEFGGLGKVSGA